MLQININLALKHFVLDVQFEVEQGIIVGVFGPSGAGKSSLLAAISGVSAGQSVTNRQQNIANLAPDKRGMSLQLQACPLFPHLDVLGNLSFACKHRPKNNNQLALNETVSLLGISDLLNREVSSLSGGEQQRIVFARTLLLGQNIILLDEPFSALDWVKKQRLLWAIKYLAKNKNITFIMVSHSLKELSYCADKMLQLKQGKMTRFGDTEIISQQINNEQGTTHFSFLNFQQPRRLSEHNLTKVSLIDSQQVLYINQFDEKSSYKICVNANDISVSLKLERNSSCINTLQCILVSFQRQQYEVLLFLDVDGQSLLCSLNPLAWQQLGVTTGQTLYAHLHAI
ncbi:MULTISPECIES: ATP-binding cassette domain-containing protein [Pseudoalteromonas]|uniref:ATP-binding cassette domain-containing protein n=1 Tax=Pseudoalteromonas TaxID=53246 RepID=UPI0002FBB4A7|nr:MULTISPECIES: ATP-binding cassette domain-containing protein [Pseudoalteromonas]MCF6143227.1 molybdate transport system ATP-binding protein [Pseudoalteromonas mariniglutinosa NCIMB 1770]